jgi:hypothetical protein
MKNNILILLGFVTIVFLHASCGRGTNASDTYYNKYLGKLPGIAKKYTEKIDKKKKDLKECTDFEESFKLSKELELLDDEVDKAIDEYLASNPITNVPFEQKADYQFKIKEVWIESASDYRINFKAKVTITEDIKNDWGYPPGFAKNFFAYIIAVDKEGKSLTRKHGVMMNYTRNPFKAGMEVEMYGSLDGTADLINFEKLVFVSKESLENPK